MKQYLSEEPDLAPFKDMFLWKNAKWLFGKTEEKPKAETTAHNMIVRIAEIEVYPQHLKEYLEYANEVDRLSIEREPGVVCLYPMQSAEDSCQIRISSEDRPFPEIQARHAPHGEESETPNYEASRP